MAVVGGVLNGSVPIEQQQQNIEIPGMTHRQHKRGQPVAVLFVNIKPLVEEVEHDFYVVAQHRQMQQRLPFLIRLKELLMVLNAVDKTIKVPQTRRLEDVVGFGIDHRDGRADDRSLLL